MCSNDSLSELIKGIPMLHPFGLNQVQLLPSLFKDRFDLNLKYMMSLRSENLLQAALRHRRRSLHRLLPDSALTVTA